jgi:NAD(P) transhydrogenase subunit beta
MNEALRVLYYSLSGVAVLMVLVGLILQSKVRSALAGNLLALCSMVLAVALVTVCYYKTGTLVPVYIALALGAAAGIVWAVRSKMIEMPQTVALLNGLGGAASAFVAAAALIEASSAGNGGLSFENVTSGIAVVIGCVTLTGSLIAAGKLSRVLKSAPVTLPGHGIWTLALIVLTVASLALGLFVHPAFYIVLGILSLLFGVLFVIRVGGADMPITISLLNSLSGVAGGIAGMAVGDPLLVCVGGVVGASGLLLTQNMCKAMNRRLSAILTGATSAPQPAAVPGTQPEEPAPADDAQEAKAAPAEEERFTEEAAAELVRKAKKVILVAGYGMALSQAQGDVAQLARALTRNGAEVKFAIHPVAGRMPGHMSVLLCEADVDYDALYMMDDINPEFAQCDIAISVGANDVTNPAANTAEGTPIYGMPVLSLCDAPYRIMCCFDTKPGYAGVPNPLFTDPRTLFLEGDAKDSVQKILGWLA